MKLHKDNRGMSLIEVMAAGMILTIALTLLASGFFAAYKVISDGDRLKSGGNQAEDLTDAAELSGGADSAGRVLVLADGTTVSIDGFYVDVNGGTGSNNDFRLFRTQGNKYPSPLDMYHTMVGMPDTFTNMSDDDKTYWAGKLGVGHLYASNDLYRKYMLLDKYGGIWPEFPQELLPDALKGTRYYIQPFMANPAKTGCDVAIFLGTQSDATGGWRTRMVYDHECDAWFYKKMGDVFTMTSMNYNATPLITWNDLHQQMHDDSVTWVHME